MQDVALQLLERSDPSIDAVIAMELGYGIARDLDTLLLTGSGTAPYLSRARQRRVHLDALLHGRTADPS
ncbi:MAG: hypothetical protein H0U19_11535 [Acidobacteria bacterium]|nr:hypothetical protein [Acidobacteriota bacterium]